MNKFYIQIVFFLLSVSVYLNNKTLATEPAPEKVTKTESKNSYTTSEEIYESNKHLLCANPEEIQNAEKLMNEAIEHLEYHATSEDGYKSYEKGYGINTSYYKKKHNDNTDVKKFIYIKDDPNKYNKLVADIWNPNILNPFDYKSTKRKISRVYNPNLVIIQQRYKKSIFSRWKYFYALATKVEISEDKTIIVMTSANIIDHHPSDKEYKNTIVESANLFKIDIDSEEDIRKGKLNKNFLNIGGHLIEKKDNCVKITRIESID
ncbi:fam-a protein [Plasmodium chabaudi chabaudi]|uniref:Fam-a protein n=1 Tax=Plasmodium chabaudi chabaudi TaxID=31271 RepID=A0A1C6WSR4_PLACU|nr:fam-a protein [Plasmodium chabaudi chabaudi]